MTPDARLAAGMIGQPPGRTPEEHAAMYRQATPVQEAATRLLLLAVVLAAALVYAGGQSLRAAA